MTIRVAINGYGRIGRMILRAHYEYGKKHDIEIVAINASGGAEINEHLTRYDSVHGRFNADVSLDGDHLVVNGDRIRLLSQRDALTLPWAELGVDVVLECTGAFTTKEKAGEHIQAGAKKVIISAPAKGDVLTVVMGVNEKDYDPKKHHIISNASCTTNCIAPVIKILHDNFGITRGLMTTAHSYTNDQRLLDQQHKDLRRARSAAINIVPTSTGAARVVGVVIPELKGKLNGIALRVPTPTVSICDFVADLKQKVTAVEINQVFKVAAEGEYKGILEYCEEPLVSVDFKGNPASAIFDAESTMVIDGNMVKVLAWYDNEWGYSCRLVDLTAYVISRGL